MTEHIVAIVGGATAGAEAAAHLAERGVSAVVFEMGARPFGKIEDGLPRWHARQRQGEYEKIKAKLTRPGVHFVPNTMLGRDVDFLDLVKRWGFSAVLLANGAWRDRPLPLEGAEACVGRGLLYQNPLIHWYNHYPEAHYDGPRYSIPEGAIVLGGGLASIDVAKICMFETVERALKARGLEGVGLGELDRGIPRALAKVGLTFEALAIEPCTLYYRRRARDMPISNIPPCADEARLAKAHATREKMMANFMRKFCFRFEPNRAPESLIIETDQAGPRALGVRFVPTEIRDGRVHKRSDLPLVEARSELIVSSIGSLPQPIPGIEMDGDYYRFADDETGCYIPLPGVFGLGNVITGKGNIRVSMEHSRQIADQAARDYLGGGEGPPPSVAERAGSEAAEQVAWYVKGRQPLDPVTASRIMERVEARQRAVGYENLEEWLARHQP